MYMEYNLLCFQQDHPFIKRSERNDVDVAGYVFQVIEQMPQQILTFTDTANSS